MISSCRPPALRPSGILRGTLSVGVDVDVYVDEAEIQVDICVMSYDLTIERI